MREFLSRVGPNDRVLLVGDIPAAFRRLLRSSFRFALLFPSYLYCECELYDPAKTFHSCGRAALPNSSTSIRPRSYDTSLSLPDLTKHAVVRQTLVEQQSHVVGNSEVEARPSGGLN
jgi:hypothetical protein